MANSNLCSAASNTVINLKLRHKNKAASKRVCESLLTHKASGSRFNEVKRTKETLYYGISKSHSFTCDINGLHLWQGEN